MSIENVVSEGLCISCGICAGNCPKECIELIRYGFEYVSQVDNSKCINCNICNKVCPSVQWMEYNPKEPLVDYMIGDLKKIVAAKTKDESILKEATSGGVITQLVSSLLEASMYNSAFLIKGHSYDDFEIKTERYVKGDLLSGSPKSRYLTVSHKDAVRYMINHKNEKIIIIGTGCVVQGFLNTINLHKLNRNNYLIIGLFCDKTMHYGVIEYFKNHPINNGREIKEFFFRSKDAGGWPGNVKIVYKDNSVEILKNTERMAVKEYFMPERCLYCLDKLNRNCDISVGDNYAPYNTDANGISTVILRTDKAIKVWTQFSSLFVSQEDTKQNLEKAQVLHNKIKNYQFATIKGIFESIALDNNIQKDYRSSLRKIRLGKIKDDLYKNVNRDIKRTRMINICKHLICHPYDILKKYL